MSDDDDAAPGAFAGFRTRPADPEDSIDPEDAVDPAPAPLSSEDRRVRQALLAGLLIVAALTGLVGWLSFRTALADRGDLRRDEYLAVARRFAVDLTTVDYQNPQADVQRVLDAATGEFYQRFADRAPLLIETVTREHAQAVSSISAIGVQSQSRTGDRARVLVALSVASAHLGGLEERPHEMRMRLTMNWVDDRAKVSNVEYVR